MMRLLFFDFRISAKTLGKQIVVYHSELTALRCAGGTTNDQFCWRNRRPSASKCFFHEQLSLDLAHLRRPTFVLSRAHTHWSMIRHLWRSYKRLLKHRERIFPTFRCTNRHEFFWAIVKLFGIQRDHIFSKAKCSCHIEYILVEEMSKDAFISRYVIIRA